MNEIRIHIENFDRALTRATGLGLTIATVRGDADSDFVNITARQIGVRGNHEPKWTDAQRAAFAAWGAQ
jgi:hypothetical protein